MTANGTIGATPPLTHTMSRRRAVAAFGAAAAGISLGWSGPGVRPALTLVGNPVLTSGVERRMSRAALRRASVRRLTLGQLPGSGVDISGSRLQEDGSAPAVFAHLKANGRVCFAGDLGRAAGSTISDLEDAIFEASAPGEGDGEDGMPSGFDRPDERGEVWGGFEYEGRKLQCPVPRSLRQRNTDGSGPGPSDGLCVIASQVTDGRWQEQVAAMARLWEVAKTREGGYWPERMKEVSEEIVPDIPFKSYEGESTRWMDEILGRGIPIGVTMGTGRGYRYQDISHMVSLVGIWRDLAAIIDNNFPGWVAWMPRREFDRRFTMTSGYGWGWYWDIDMASPLAAIGPSRQFLAGGLAGAAVLAGIQLGLRARTERSFP